MKGETRNLDYSSFSLELVLKLVPELGQYPKIVAKRKKTLKKHTFLRQLAIFWRRNFEQPPHGYTENNAFRPVRLGSICMLLAVILEHGKEFGS